MQITITKDQVCVASDLYSLGRHWEDGEELFGDVFYLSVTLDDGTRYRHPHCYPNRTKEREYCEHEGCEVEFYPWHLDAEERCQAFCDAVAAHGSIDTTHWREEDPAYGSEQYQRQGIERERAFMDRFDD